MTCQRCLTAAIAALALLSACDSPAPPAEDAATDGTELAFDDMRPDAPEQGPAQPVDAILRLLPTDADTPFAYCDLQSDGQLRITVENAGNGASAGGETLIVTFLTPVQQSSVASLPPIPAGMQQSLDFSDPVRCLSRPGRNCDFTIQLMQRDAISGSCLQ